MGETIQFVPSMLDAGNSGSRELQIFNTRKPLYEFNKDFTFDSERNFSADLLFRYSLFFQIRSNIFNCRKWLCTHRGQFLFLWWPRLFSALWVSAVTQEYSIFKIQIFLCSVFQFKIFPYHRPVIFPDEVVFPVILFESSIFTRPGQILQMTSFLFFNIFLLFFFRTVFFFPEFLPHNHFLFLV